MLPWFFKFQHSWNIALHALDLVELILVVAMSVTTELQSFCSFDPFSDILIAQSGAIAMRSLLLDPSPVTKVFDSIFLELRSTFVTAKDVVFGFAA